MSAQHPSRRPTIRSNRYIFAWDGSHRAGLLLLCAAAAAAVFYSAACLPVRFDDSPPVYPRRLEQAFEKIDPNTATVASLRRLGGIGRHKAQAIADYRRSARGRAFARPEDLARVRGIGPSTVRRAEPYLVFYDNDGL